MRCERCGESEQKKRPRMGYVRQSAERVAVEVIEVNEGSQASDRSERMW